MELPLAAHEFGREWTTILAPCSIDLPEVSGKRIIDNERNPALGNFQTAAMSVMRPPGLAMDSMKMALSWAAGSIEFMSSTAHTTLAGLKMVELVDRPAVKLAHSDEFVAGLPMAEPINLRRMARSNAKAGAPSSAAILASEPYRRIHDAGGILLKYRSANKSAACFTSLNTWAVVW
jgi:hypothetical protein